MKKILLLPLVLVTGCTTIGQQITNKDGIVQVHQQQSPVTANTNTNAVTKPIAKTKTTNSITTVTAKPQDEMLVEVTETLISRQYILN
jgi:hypothetical protein